MKLDYELLDTDKYKRVKISRLNKEAKGKARNVKQINQVRHSKALKYIVGLLLIAGAIFITYKLIGHTINAEAHKKNGVVMALAQETTNVEAVQAPQKSEVDVVPVLPVEPTPVPTCASETAKYNWNVRVAFAVCMAESRSIVNAANMNDIHATCVGSYSLMQVACFWYYYYGYTDADFLDPVVNVQIAYNIWQRQGGFGAWTTYTSGEYLKHLQ